MSPSASATSASDLAPSDPTPSDPATPELPEFIARQFPFRRRTHTLRRGPWASRRMHFVDHGPDASSVAGNDGDARPTVLLLHGNPTWSFLWRKVIGGLGEFRVVAPDLMGLGLSDKLPRIDDHSLERHADAIAELVEALDLRDIVLVGQDWGGPTAASVGARHPDRVAALLLANTAVILPKVLRGTSFHRFARRPLLSDLAFRVFGFPLGVLHKTQADPGSISGDVKRAYKWPLRRIRDRAAPLAMARMVPDGPDHPGVPEMQRGEAWAKDFAGPVHLVWGVEDPVLGRALQRHREAFPEAPVDECRAGHFLQEEVPEVLVAAIRRLAVRSRLTPEPVT